MVVGSRFVRSLRGYSAAGAAVPVLPKPRRNEAVVVGWLPGYSEYSEVFGGSGGAAALRPLEIFLQKPRLEGARRC
jgi:hypothetical protein